MSASRKTVSLALRLAAGVLLVAAAFFAIGFIFGYLMWLPKLSDSRLRQAVNWGLVCLVISLILDPILVITLAWYFARKTNDSSHA